jgi:DNA-binding CsgD family transcriptional regulator
MDPSATLEAAREAFRQRRWSAAYSGLQAAGPECALEPADADRLATAAYLLARDTEATAGWAQAFHGYVASGQPARAARCGFWLSLTPLLRGEFAQSAGWLARAERLLEEAAAECAERGCLLVVRGLHAMGGGDARGASALFDEALARAARHKDADSRAFALLGRGQTCIQTQQHADGVAALDEAMVSVANGEVSPIAAGIIYCAVILACQQILDLRRAREWTLALADWCAAQPELVSFRGQCLVHRSEVLQLDGDWTAALTEAQRACAQHSDSSDGGGRAYYQHAELLRLTGRYAEAEQTYREAGMRGCDPQPGLSLLRLAQGDVPAAQAAMSRLCAEGGPGNASRVGVLSACVEIMLAASDVRAARKAAEELAVFAGKTEIPVVRAAAAEANGAVRLAEGDAAAAVADLRVAWTTWQSQNAAYPSARVRVLLASACRRLGDEDTAAIHFDAARAVFQRLGATPDLDRLERAATSGSTDAGHPLTERELEVLALVASGRKNREIAVDLAISEHTVARHLSNIFTKLDVTSRTAATAFALERGLV